LKNKNVTIDSNTITDTICAHGRNVYRIKLSSSNYKNQFMEENLVQNPSFEISHNIGIPDWYSFSVNAGSSAIIEPGISQDGLHSLHLISSNGGSTLNQYPILLCNESTLYSLTFWAMAPNSTLNSLYKTLNLLVSLKSEMQQRYTISTDGRWREYKFNNILIFDYTRYSVNYKLLERGEIYLDSISLIKTTSGDNCKK